MGRQARPACSPCGSKPISDKSQGVWGTASPNLFPSSHVRPHSESIPSFTLKNSPSITALTLTTPLPDSIAAMRLVMLSCSSTICGERFSGANKSAIHA